jgi:RHS repeat-associated protein
MSGGGALRAFFVGAQEDTAQAVEDAAGQLGKLGDDTMQKALDSVTTVEDADGASADAINGIRGKLGADGARELPGGGPDRAAGPLNGDSSAPGSPGKDPGQQATEDAHLDGEGGATDDPVDVVTGEMFLAQQDLTLPGVLPLVLSRRHGSNYRHGRLFGSSWASTLEQRVEIDDQEIRLLLEDGRILRYPVPADGERVMPTRGPRWPLISGGDGAVTVEQGDLGQTLHFLPDGPEPGHTRLLAAISDRAGNQISFAYDDSGFPADVRHSGGYHVKIGTRATLGGARVTSLALMDPEGGPDVTVREFRYDMSGRLTGVVNESGQPLAFEYDEAQRITRWADRNGFEYRYVYGPDGRVVRGEGTGGFLDVELDYELDAQVTTVTDALGNSADHYWNDQLRTVKVADPLGNETVTQHDRYGEITGIIDALGRVTRIDRDAYGDALRVHRPDGTTVATVYDEQRNPVTVTGPDGATWSYEYDAAGVLSSVTGPDLTRSEYCHDQANRVTECIDPLGRVTRIACNGAGLPVELAGPDGAATRLRRDAFGRVIEITEPHGARTQLTWTVDGKPLTRVLPDGAREAWRYDAEGNLLEYVNPAGAVTSFEYGPFDAVIARTEPDGGRCVFGYDRALNLTSVTGPTGCTWTYEYDACGNLVRETDFNGAAQSYTLDSAGQLIERVNAVGQVSATAYDAMGRVVSQRTADGVHRYSYDLAGQLLRTAGPGSEIEFTRDVAGRVVSESVNGRSVTSVYDLAGDRTERTTPGGVVSHWTYDASGRPVVLAGTGGSLAFGYDSVGRETTRRLGPSTVLTSAYDEIGRLTSQGLWRIDQPGQSTDAPGTDGRRPVQSRAWTYRADGTPARVDDQLRGTRGFELDPVGRVTAVEVATWRETYVYDPLGNLARATVPGGEPDSDGEREVAGTLVRRAGRTRYEYDGAGRLIRRTRVTLSGQRKEWHYTWDAEDRLTGVTVPSGRRYAYAYDSLGRRIAKTGHDADGTILGTTHFIWDGPRMIEEINVDGDRVTATTWDHEPGTFKPAAQTRRTWVDGATPEQVDHEFYAIVTDLAGTPAEMVTPDGRVAWRAQASLWGQTASAPGSTAYCPLRFPGQYHDDETGLDYSYFRYYSPEDAAFLSPDPLGLTPAPNNHAYVANPLAWIDPTGLAPCPSTVTVKWEEGMPKSQFKVKAKAMQKLSDDGKLYKAPNPVDRDQSITRNYKSDVIKRVYKQFGKNNPEFADQLAERVRAMNPDHVWELQLGGPDVASNLHILDAFTNQRIGNQIWQQIRELPDHTPIRLRFEGPPT